MTNAAQRTGTGLCANCGWTRAAMLYDGRIVFSASHDGPAGVREPKKCYECRTWSSMRTLASLPDRVEAAARAWWNSIRNEAREDVMWDDLLPIQRERYHARMGEALAAADACEAERAVASTQNGEQFGWLIPGYGVVSTERNPNPKEQQ
jgi:hypothetical protein